MNREISPSDTSDPDNRKPSSRRQSAPSAPERQPLVATAIDWGDVAAAPAEEMHFNIRTLWYGFRRRWGIALGLGILCAMAAGATGWFLLEPDFTATGYLRIASIEPRLLNSTGSQGDASGGFEIYKRTQKELIMSRYVLNAALRGAKAAEIPQVRDHVDPVTWLANEIRVDFPGNAEIMTISMSGESPEQIATLVNAVLDAYQQEVVLVEKNQRTEKLNTLEKVVRDAEEKSRRGRADLRRLADTLGTGDSQALTLKQQIALQRYASMLGEQTRVQIALMQAEIDLAAAKGKQEAGAELDVQPAELWRYVEADPRVVEHRRNLKQAEELLKGAKKTAAPARAEGLVARHHKTAEEAKAAAAEMERKVREEAESMIRDGKRRDAASQTSAEVAEAENDVILLKAQLAALQKELTTLSEEANKIGRSSVDVEMMRVEIQRIDDVARRLNSEIENIRVDLQSPARISLLSRAEIPAFRDTKKQTRGVLGLAVVWFVLPVLAVAWHESRARRIYAAADTRHLFGVRVLGALPLLITEHRCRTQRVLQNRLAFRESIDGLRTVLLREAEFASVKAVMVTSASCGEGKTSVASQLASSLARVHRSCLLVDFDLRRPAAHRMLGLSADRGICEVLRGELEIDDVVQATDAENLSFIAAGTFDDEALVALTHSQLPQCLTALRERFEFIILDSSPILPVVDAVLIGKYADAVVLSVLCDVSRKPAIESACARLDAMGVRILGAVVTGPQDKLVYDAGSYQYLSTS